jgi:hypothetical protein
MQTYMLKSHAMQTVEKLLKENPSTEFNVIEANGGYVIQAHGQNLDIPSLERYGVEIVTDHNIPLHPESAPTGITAPNTPGNHGPINAPPTNEPSAEEVKKMAPTKEELVQQEAKTPANTPTKDGTVHVGTEPAKTPADTLQPNTTQGEPSQGDTSQPNTSQPNTSQANTSPAEATEPGAVPAEKPKKEPKPKVKWSTMWKTAPDKVAARVAKGEAPFKPGSKRDITRQLLEQEGGCTVEEAMTALGWDKQTVMSSFTEICTLTPPGRRKLVTTKGAEGQPNRYSMGPPMTEDQIEEERKARSERKVTLAAEKERKEKDRAAKKEAADAAAASQAEAAQQASPQSPQPEHAAAQ